MQYAKIEVEHKEEKFEIVIDDTNITKLQLLKNEFTKQAILLGKRIKGVDPETKIADLSDKQQADYFKVIEAEAQCTFDYYVELLRWTLKRVNNLELNGAKFEITDTDFEDELMGRLPCKVLSYAKISEIKGLIIPIGNAILEATELDAEKKPDCEQS